MQKVGVTVSHSVIIRWLNKLGNTHDAELINWKNLITESLDFFDEEVKSFVFKRLSSKNEYIIAELYIITRWY